MMRAWVAFAMIVGLAGVVRFYHLGRNSYWQDEMMSLKDSGGPRPALNSLPVNVVVRGLPHWTVFDSKAHWWQLWGLADWEINPPLYFVALHEWRGMFGDSEFAVRSFSAIGSLVGVILFYLCLRVQGSEVIALWGAALMAVAGPQINAAQNARDYPMWLALAMGAAYATLLMERRGVSWGRCFGLGVCSLGMLLTHYFAAFSVMSLGIYALIFLRGKSRKAVVGALGAGVVGFFLLWGKYLLHQEHDVGNWVLDRTGHPHWHLVLRVVEWPLRGISVVGDHGLAAVVFFLLMVWGGMVAIRKNRPRCDSKLLIGANGAKRGECGGSSGSWAAKAAPTEIGYCVDSKRGDGGGNSAGWFWGIWIIPLVGCTVFLDWRNGMRMLDVSRYTMVAMSGVCALVPMIAYGALGRFGWVGAGAIFVLGLVTVPWAYPLPTEWRDVAMLLEQNAGKDDVVVYTGGYWNPAEPMILYLGMDHYAPDLAAGVVLLTDVKAPIARELPAGGGKLWVVCYEPDLDLERVFPRGKIVQQMVLPNVGRVGEMERGE